MILVYQLRVQTFKCINAINFYAEINKYVEKTHSQARKTIVERVTPTEEANTNSLLHFERRLQLQESEERQSEKSAAATRIPIRFVIRCVFRQ